MILEAQDDMAVVGEAATGAQAVAAASALRPDVICMDVQMPDMDGITATRAITADPGIPSSVVIVTTFDHDDYLFEALDAGASGFVLKNAGPEELVAAVRTIAGGDALLAPEVTRRVIERFAGVGAPARATASAAPEPTPPTAAAMAVPSDLEPLALPDHLPDPLTEREAEVLRLIAQAMSNSEIARQLYIGEATVKTHVSKVLQKLGARDRVQAVVFAHRRGLS
ncbi:response regulator [Microbacterium sp.]|uniref:response regulator n=1 Tax=Microbacterium sp. TaxID=51671 RepID=UPI0039C900FC